MTVSAVKSNKTTNMNSEFTKILEYSEVVMEMLLKEITKNSNNSNRELLTTYIMSLENILDGGRQFCNPFTEKDRYDKVVKNMYELRSKMEEEIGKIDKNVAFEIAWNNLNRTARFLGLPERILIK